MPMSNAKGTARKPCELVFDDEIRGNGEGSDEVEDDDVVDDAGWICSAAMTISLQKRKPISSSSSRPYLSRCQYSMIFS